MFSCRLSSVFHSLFSPPVVTVRYQKTDGRFATTSFNHASLADGRDHHVMLHASGLQRGPPRLNVYIDCRLVHTLDDLPAAFGSLPPGPNKVALRTLQSSGQVNKRFTVRSNYTFDCRDMMHGYKIIKCPKITAKIWTLFKQCNNLIDNAFHFNGLVFLFVFYSFVRMNWLIWSWW